MTESLLAEAAAYFYEACELWDDDDLDMDDIIAVLHRAFRSSDCDDFAAVLSRMTDWDVVSMTWRIPGYGFGHHALVRDPEGRLLDVGGWTDEDKLRKAFGIKVGKSVGWTEGHISSPMHDEGDEAVELIEAIIRNLPYAPFNVSSFKSRLGASVSASPDN